MKWEIDVTTTEVTQELRKKKTRFYSLNKFLESPNEFY